MSNVVRLPDRMERQWRVFETGLRAKILGEGVPVDVADAALKNLRPVYLEFARHDRITIHPGTVDDPVAAINEWATQLCMGLLGAVLLREIELIMLRGTRPDDAPW